MDINSFKHLLKVLTWTDTFPNTRSGVYGVLMQAIGVGSTKGEVLLKSK
jgi:hypothetical protein